MLHDERFRVDRSLGKGGFGIVYEAFDLQRQARVALKLLHGIGAGQPLPAEARVSRARRPRRIPISSRCTSCLADRRALVLHDGARRRGRLHHVRLGRHRSERADERGDRAGGRSSCRRAKRARARAAASCRATVRARSRANPQSTAGRAPPARRRADVVCTARACCIAISSRRTCSSRTKAASSFSTSAWRRNRGRTTRNRSTVQGTPAYMSPEHASGLGTSEASDWYMRGRHVVRSHHRADAVPRLVPRSAQGEARAVSAAAERSRTRRARAISTRSATICCSPKRRAGQAGATCSRVSAVEAGTPSRQRRRRSRRAAVRRSSAADGTWRRSTRRFKPSRGGQAEVVFVRGRSGMGKTALVRRFLRDVRQRDAHAVTLVGRCYERESVPYKALDTIVDAVAQYLKQLGAGEADAVLPRDVMALARLFPVLREVEAVASGAPSSRRDSRRAGAAPPRVRRAARAAEPAVGPTPARALHRRHAVGRPRQLRAARRALAPPDRPRCCSFCRIGRRNGHERGAAHAAAARPAGARRGARRCARSRSAS